MSNKIKTQYQCQQCGATSPKWAGQCTGCESWNTLIEAVVNTPNKSSRFKGFAGESVASVVSLHDVALTHDARMNSGLHEFDRVLGGGLVAGSVVLIGGDPGVGKSTLVLQSLASLSQQTKVLYVTGEESLAQVKMRAQRLALNADAINLMAETQVENILQAACQHKPNVIVIDSIQTLYTELVQSAPGGVSQVRESAAQLVQFAKKTQTALFLIGHVTKEGNLAGPRVLEHMVDAVLYFEGDSSRRFRLLRAIKNRFGAVNELGVFAMTEKGLKEVSNPSAIFLTRTEPAPGSSVLVTWEGTRPLLVEIQALVDATYLPQPRRVTVGLEHNRLAMLLAILHRHAGIATFDQDVFVNAVGGVKITETAADLALLASVVSSLKNKPLHQGLIIFGEVGLAGEVRPVPNGQERLNEAQKHGFKQAIVPKANAPKKTIKGVEVFGVSNVMEAMQLLC